MISTLVGSTNGQFTSYSVRDHLGSLVGRTTESGGFQTTAERDPWGSSVETVDFTGREHDPETGLHYFRARQYSSAIGRFLSEDPIGIAGGTNLYAYVGNNPIERVDPNGLKGISQAGRRSCCEIIRQRKSTMHCMLDVHEHGRDPEECFRGGLAVQGASLQCWANTPDPIDMDAIRRNFDPCIADCALAHEERHAEQCRRFGDKLMGNYHRAERGGYMVELGCLIRKEREACRCPGSR